MGFNQKNGWVTKKKNNKKLLFRQCSVRWRGFTGRLCGLCPHEEKGNCPPAPKQY